MSFTKQKPVTLGKRLDELADSLGNLEEKISQAPPQVKMSYYRELDRLEARHEKLRELATKTGQDRSSETAKSVQQELASFESALKDAYLRFTDRDHTEESDEDL